jgi:hypothetical protein
MVIILQQRVEELEKTVKELNGIVEKLQEAINHGQITQIQKDSEDKQDQKIQVVGNKRALPDAAEETVLCCLEEVDINGQEDKTEKAGDTECVEETVLGCLEDVSEQENTLGQTGEAESVEESVLGRVEDINVQEDKVEEAGEAECVEETVLGCLEDANGQDNTLGQTGEVECSEETVFVHEEGLQGEDIGTEAATQSHQGMFNRRIRFIGIFVVSCAVGMLLWGVYKWSVYGWGVDESVSTIPVRNWIPPRH